MLQLFASKLGSKSQQKAQNKKKFFSSFAIQNITHIFIHASIIIKYVFSYTTIVLNVNSQKIFKNLRKLPAAAPQLYYLTIVHTHHVRASFSYGHPHEILQRHFPNFFFGKRIVVCFSKKVLLHDKKVEDEKGGPYFLGKSFGP